MCVIATMLCLLLLLVWPASGALIKRRPDGDVGPLLVSSDDRHTNYNTGRLMVFFDRECLNLLEPFSSIHSNQHRSISSLITNHYPCLSSSLNNVGEPQHFDFSSHNLAVSFLDVDDSTGPCLDSSQVSSKSVNYTSHCINHVTHEPRFSLAQNMSEIVVVDGCATFSTDFQTQWALDAADSSELDNLYTYPVIETDAAEVDIYVLDSGILSSHEEFEPGQVTHVIGDGPTTFETDEGDIWVGSHGTHVAGTASGKEYGRSKNVSIYDYRVCEYAVDATADDEYYCYVSLMMTALADINDKLAASSRRGVINLSLGSSKTIFDYFYEYYFEMIENNGGIVVVAAGNGGGDACDFAPAFASSAITVGASDYNYKKYSSSNYGDCVDVWAAGVAVYGAAADNSTSYVWASGTSAASPGIVGNVANLLWTDATLTLREIKYILSSSSVTVTGDECDTYTCVYPIYNCSYVPQLDLEPTTSETLAYYVYDGVIQYDSCNYFAVAEIDHSAENTDNYNNYFVESLTYGATDKCVAQREEHGQDAYSWAVECTGNETADLKVWLNDDCDGDGTIVRTLQSGEVVDDDWYIVDCDNVQDRNNEALNVYDNTDCDIVVRYWYLREEEKCSDVDESTHSFEDQVEVFGACNVVRDASDESLTYSFEHLCFQNKTLNLSYLLTYYYAGDSCNESLYTGEDYLFEGCYEYNDSSGGFVFEVLECGNVDLYFERNNVDDYYFTLTADDVTAGTWILIWFAMAIALLCCCIAICVVVVTFETFWQREKCHCPFRIPLISPHSSLSKSKIQSMNDNIEPLFRILTTLIVFVYAASLVITTIGQCVQNSAIADYAANEWEYEKSIEDAYVAGSNMTQYSFYFWIYCKVPLYILFISRLWYVFKGTKYEYPKPVFAYFGVMLVVQTYLATHWLFIDRVVLRGFWDVVFLFYSFFDLAIIGSCVWLFIRRLTSLAVAQSVERSVKTGEISVVQGSTQSSGSTNSGSRPWRVLSQQARQEQKQQNIQAVQEDDDEEATGSAATTSTLSPRPGKNARPHSGTATSQVEVKDVKNTDLVSLDKRQLKLIFEITRYTLLTLLAMLSTFTLGVVICYCYYRQDQYPYDGCNISCLITTYAAQSFVQAIDCFINVLAIHLNSGFQKKNYEVLCKYPHNWVEVHFVRSTKRRIVTKTNKKLNEGIDMTVIEEAQENENAPQQQVDNVVQADAGTDREIESDLDPLSPPMGATDAKKVSSQTDQKPKKPVVAETNDWEFD